MAAKTTAERVAAYRRRQRERLVAAEAAVASLNAELAAARLEIAALRDQLAAAEASAAAAAADRDQLAVRLAKIESNWIVRLLRL